VTESNPISDQVLDANPLGQDVLLTLPRTLHPHELPFWQRDWVQNILPWVTSFFFHITAFTVALVLVPPLVRSVLSEPSREQIMIPDAALATDTNIGGAPNPGMGADPTRQANQENDSNVDTQGWAQRKSDNLTQALDDTSITGSDIIAAGSQKTIGRGSDNSALNPLGEHGGGTMAAFGPRGGGQGNGPKSKIFGHGGNVHSIIYVCDASGSMVGRADDSLRRELKRDIANLSPVQQFNILIFHRTAQSSEEYQKLSSDLLMGTPKNKSLAFDFVDNLQFSNINNPIPALNEAFREQPELVFLLSHGDFNNMYNTTDNQQVLDAVNSLNHGKKTHVNTILLLGDKDKDSFDRKDFEEIMTNIATENGGNYKKFYSDDL
jgi:hypothetical protein